LKLRLPKEYIETDTAKKNILNLILQKEYIEEGAP
jgi:hypothetical protein